MLAGSVRACVHHSSPPQPACPRAPPPLPLPAPPVRAPTPRRSPPPCPPPPPPHPSHPSHPSSPPLTPAPPTPHPPHPPRAGSYLGADSDLLQPLVRDDAHGHAFDLPGVNPRVLGRRVVLPCGHVGAHAGALLLFSCWVACAPRRPPSPPPQLPQAPPLCVWCVRCAPLQLLERDLQDGCGDWGGQVGAWAWGGWGGWGERPGGSSNSEASMRRRACVGKRVWGGLVRVCAFPSLPALLLVSQVRACVWPSRSACAAPFPPLHPPTLPTHEPRHPPITPPPTPPSLLLLLLQGVARAGGGCLGATIRPRAGGGGGGGRGRRTVHHCPG